MRDDIIFVLKKLYSKKGIAYPKDGFEAKQQFDFIASTVILHREENPRGFLNKEFIEECIASIKNYSYRDQLSFYDQLKFYYSMPEPVVTHYQKIDTPKALYSPSVIVPPRPSTSSYPSVREGRISSTTSIFRKTMASLETPNHSNSYLTIHAKIKESKDGIHNEDIMPFVKSFFENLINNHYAKKNTITPTFVLCEEIITILKRLYSEDGIVYPKDDFKAATQQFDFITNEVILYRISFPRGYLEGEFIIKCIASIRDGSYLKQSSLMNQEIDTPRALSPLTAPLPLPSHYPSRDVGSMPDLSGGKGALKNTSSCL